MPSIPKLIQLHLDNQLPNDVTVIYVPITKTHYHDYRIALPHDQANHYQPIASIAYETIQLQRYTRGREFIYAGYGEQTKTLLIGKIVDDMTGDLTQEDKTCPYLALTSKPNL